MITPRLLLVAGLLLVAAGGAITLHNQYIESSGLTEAISLASASSAVMEFRPHYPRVHFVSLLIDKGAAPGTSDCVDPHGFPSRRLDVQWVMEQDGIAIASGTLSSSPLTINRSDHRAMVLGGFWASPDHLYTLRLDTATACSRLDAFDPRIEIGLRPGQPLRGYFLWGYAFLFLGLGLLAGFTRREDKGWPYRPIFRWIERRSSRLSPSPSSSASASSSGDRSSALRRSRATS